MAHQDVGLVLPESESAELSTWVRLDAKEYEDESDLVMEKWRESVFQFCPELGTVPLGSHLLPIFFIS